MLLAAALAAPAGVRAQVPAAPDSAGGPLDGRIVRRVELVTRTIFDPLPERASALYAFANRIHVRTRPATLRATLTVREGDRWSETKRAESERHLRSLAYLVPDTLDAFAVGADSVDVRVVTHDTWTTSPEFNVESGGGQHFGSFAFTERNLLGLGTTLSLAYRDDVTGISRQAGIEDNEILGTHWRGRAAIGNGSGGNSSELSLVLPFWADAAPVSVGASLQREDFDTELFASGASAAVVRGHRERGDLSWGWGRQATDGTIQRLVLSFEARDRHVDVPERRPGAPAVTDSTAESLRIRRLAGEVRLWRPRYIVRRGVEQMDRDEDFDLGLSVMLKTGFAPHALGSTADEGYGRARLDAGFDAGPAGFGLLRAGVQTRVRSGPRETLADASARWVLPAGPRVTAVAAATGAAGRRMPADFQLGLGGISGLRAFPVHELAGDQVWRANAELRATGVRDALQLVTIGGAAFWDAGRAWGPGEDGEGWHQDAGFGLRLSLPHSALNMVARFDVAWPLSPRPDGRRGPAYSFGSGQAF